MDALCLYAARGVFSFEALYDVNGRKKAGNMEHILLPEKGRALIAPLNLIAGGLRRLRRAECGGKGPNIAIGL